MDTGLEGQLVAGRYQLLRKLGEGGMGIVYLAEHVDIEKKFALKVLLHEFAGKKDLRDRFLQEAKAAGKIGHENIVDITDFGSTPDGSVFFAMEFLEGTDLSKLIRDSGAVPWSRAKPILLQICRALGAAHAKGIIHRDMKPENIYLIEREGRADFVKLLDFGIAKMSMEENEKRITRTGMIFGTPEYMSPEQAQGNKPDQRVDIYAVGVIMYELLTGSVPFKADTFMGILTKHIFENPVPPTQANPAAGVPIEVEEVVLKAMAKDRDERFQSMTEMAAAIAQASGRMTRPTSDTSALAPRRITAQSQAMPVPAAAASSGKEASGKRATLMPELPRRNRSLLVLVLIGLVAIGGGFAVAVAVRGPPEPAKQLAAAPDAERPQVAAKNVVAGRPASGLTLSEKVAIKLASVPGGAEVYVGADKTPLGTTPGEFSLPRSKSQVQLTLRLRGYHDLSLALTPDRDRVLDEQKLVRVPPAHLAGPKPRAKVSRPEAAGKQKPAVTKKAKKKTDQVNDLRNPFGDEE